MKRRKVTGLILIISTFIYFIACLLALYQNQRVKMEKGIEEALRAYSNQESLNVKELSKDFNLRLDEMVNKEENKNQILKFEGSFERMEKNITNVTDEMAIVEYNINNLDDRLNVVENFYKELYVELTEKYDFYEVEFKYNQETKVYDRYVNGKPHKSQTGDGLTAKNILVYYVQDVPLNDGIYAPRRDLNNLGSGEGYYLSAGIATPITWEKQTHDGKTIYKTKDGAELTVNPGNTYIQLVPTYIEYTLN